jgi:hypothetical protein
MRRAISPVVQQGSLISIGKLIESTIVSDPLFGLNELPLDVWRCFAQALPGFRPARFCSSPGSLI